MSEAYKLNIVNAVLKDGQDIVIGDFLELTKDGQVQKYTAPTIAVRELDDKSMGKMR